MTVPAKSKSRPSSRLPLGWRLLFLLLLYSSLWLVLTRSDPTSWILGAPAVLLAVAASFFLSPGFSFAFNPGAALFFLPYFIFLSIMSGIDVLRRTFSQGPRINPGIINFRTSLRGGPRILLANVISLLPGTLSADLQGNQIRIHVLDTDVSVQDNIQKLENRIIRIFPHRSGAGGKT